MEIKEISNKEKWETFLLDRYPKTFLQSFNWGEFCLLMKEKIWRFGIYESQKLIGVCLVSLVKAKRGTFLFVEHGPIADLKEGAMEILLSRLKELAKQEQASFIRFCPIWFKEDIRIFKKLEFRNSPIHSRPETGWVLDLNKSEDELLAEMRKTTRYLIRQAKKNSQIKIYQDNSLEGVKKFFELYQETAKRQDFSIFSLKFLENEFNTFVKDNQISIFIGEYMGKPVSGAMIVYWQEFGFYHQGASSGLDQKIPVSYLLQWEAIKEAKKRGAMYYSFWGIAPEGKPNHPWRGLTLFKKGFGGHIEEYIPSQDYVISFKYWFNFVIETIRKIKRGFA